MIGKEDTKPKTFNRSFLYLVVCLFERESCGRSVAKAPRKDSSFYSTMFSSTAPYSVVVTIATNTFFLSVV